MARLIKAKELREGEIFCKWIENRIRNNKNVLGAETGGTGSGKSYRDLRKAELWYQYHFKNPFPAENICFSIGEVMNRLNSGELKKGEVLIFEEAGANLGSLDFQTKISKLFTYVLQSFRSMNVVIFFNLPHLDMLNKQARMLLHYAFESSGIDPKKKINKSKPFFIQVNQSTGKMYRKYLRIKVNGKIRAVKKFVWYMPSKELMLSYEKKKVKFLAELTQEFVDKLDEMEREQQRKMARQDLTEVQLEVFNLVKEGHTVKEIAEIRGVTVRSINYILELMRKKGINVKVKRKLLEKEDIEVPAPR